VPENELEEDSDSTQSDDAPIIEEAPRKVEKHSYKKWTLRVSKAHQIEKEDPSYHLNLYVFCGKGKEPISTDQ
jgi:hypothetical protein